MGAAQLSAGRMPLVKSILSAFSAAVLVLVGWVAVMLCLDLDTSALVTSVRSQAAAVQYQRSSSSSSMLQAFLNDQARTMSRVARYCEQAKLSRPVNAYLYTHDSNRDFLVCRNHKVASTTLLQIFRLHLSGIPRHISDTFVDQWGSHYSWTVDYFSTESDKHVRELSQSSILYSIVRHPYERLVSAYENKVLVKTDYIYAWFTANYGEPSFSKFVTAVLHSATRCGEDSLCQSMDSHWRPYYASCSYCDLQYNFISKMENLQRDLQVIFTDILNVELDKEYHSNERNGDSIRNKTIQYIQELSEDTKKQLYEVYRHDFEMFDYRPFY